jgi:hypothetical protein
MPPSFLNRLLDGPFEIRTRPEPIPGDLRRAYGIAIIILILGRSRGKQASLQKLHFLAHSVRTEESRSMARQVFSGDVRPVDLVIRVEPWVNRAIAFAKGDNLLELKKGRNAKLTERGMKIFEELTERDAVLVAEKAFIDQIASRATEGAIDRIMRMELSL